MCSAFFGIVKGLAVCVCVCVCVCVIHLFVLVAVLLAVTGSFADVIETMGLA